MALKKTNATIRRQRAEKQARVAIDKGLSSLKTGDKIIVTYRGGIEHEQEFLGVTRSGSVKYRSWSSGRTRHTPPQFARPASK